jgi:hypothetical protein
MCGIKSPQEFLRSDATMRGNPVLADIVAQLVPRTTLSLALFERRDLPSCALDEHPPAHRPHGEGRRQVGRAGHAAQSFRRFASDASTIEIQRSRTTSC